PVDSLTQHPVDALLAFETLHNSKIPLPPQIFPERKNSDGINIDIQSEAQPFEQQVHHFLSHQWQAAPIVNGQSLFESMIKENMAPVAVTAPYDRRVHVGQVYHSSLDHVSEAIAIAQAGF
ncbi:bifunctional proline dehydrogenase/L-glutamate gamma-semialdehyde dehydrogenase, partial [Vibrio cholerae]